MHVAGIRKKATLTTARSASGAGVLLYGRQRQRSARALGYSILIELVPPPWARLAFIDRAIRAGTWPNGTTLGRQLEVTPRTAQRDLEFLRDRLQAPIEFDAVRNGYHYTDRDYQLPFVRLTESELAALFLAERLLPEYRGTPYAAALASLFDKLKPTLDGEVSLDLSHLADALSVCRLAGLDGDPAIFGQLARAARERRRLELVYWTASRDSECWRMVDP